MKRGEKVASDTGEVDQKGGESEGESQDDEALIVQRQLSKPIVASNVESEAPSIQESTFSYDVEPSEPAKYVDSAKKQHANSVAAFSAQPEQGLDLDHEMQDVHAAHSDQHPSTPDSVFDLPEDSPAISKTAVPTAISKRKRRPSDNGEPSKLGQGNMRKKPRRSIFSPPTSIGSIPETNLSGRSHLPGSMLNSQTSGAISTKLRLVERGSPSSRQVLKTQPTLNNWAQPLSSDKSYKHPIFNPASQNQKKAMSPNIVISESEEEVQASPRAKTYGKRKQRASSIFLEESSGHAVSSRKPTFGSSSRKGKEKPLLKFTVSTKSAVENLGDTVRKDSEKHSSPTSRRKRREHSGPVARHTDDGKAKGGNSSTRTTPLYGSAKGRKKAVARKSFSYNSESEEGSESPESMDLGSGAESNIDDSKRPGKYVCNICHQRFKQQKSFLKHKSNGHLDKKGQMTQGESSGGKGRFTSEEVNKLNKFRQSFCDEHEIDYAQFNEMMTETYRKGATWTWRFITKEDLLSQYYNVLPHRDRRSMMRYRERNFQNIEQTKVWTRQDDDYLVQLFTELGPRWVEIGLRLTRTQDAVSQRWRHKLQHRQDRNDGGWTEDEVEQLKTAVEELKEKLGVAQDRSTDLAISWSRVSDRIGNIRTAQQCSMKWKRIVDPAPRKRGRPRGSLVGKSSAGRKSSVGTVTPSGKGFLTPAVQVYFKAKTEQYLG